MGTFTAQTSPLATGRVMTTTQQDTSIDAYADQLIVLADGERVFDGSPRELEQATGTTGLDFERAFVEYLHQRGH